MTSDRFMLFKEQTARIADSTKPDNNTVEFVVCSNAATTYR